MTDADELPAEVSRLYAQFVAIDADRDPERSIRAGERVLEAIGPSRAPRVRSHMHGMLGQLHLEKQPLTQIDVDAAIREYQASAAVDEESRPLEWTWAQKSLGVAYLQKGDRHSFGLAIDAVEAAADRQRELGEVREWMESSILLAQILAVDGSSIARLRAQSRLEEVLSTDCLDCAALKAAASAELARLEAG